MKNGCFDDDIVDSGNDEVQQQDDIENHGIACTCCVVRFKSLITDEDMNQLIEDKRLNCCEMMIIKVVVGEKDIEIEMRVVPFLSNSKKVDAYEMMKKNDYVEFDDEVCEVVDMLSKMKR